MLCWSIAEKIVRRPNFELSMMLSIADNPNITIAQPVYWALQHEAQVVGQVTRMLSS